MTYSLAGADLIKKQFCPNLNHSIPEIGTNQFHKGTNIGPKATHTLADLGNMFLLPKLTKRRKFDPCKSWAAVVPESLLKKMRQVGEAQVMHKRRIFGNNGLTKFWGFVGLHFAIVKILWPDPLP